jgi:hypothetical protein
MDGVTCSAPAQWNHYASGVKLLYFQQLVRARRTVSPNECDERWDPLIALKKQKL